VLELGSGVWYNKCVCDCDECDECEVTNGMVESTREREGERERERENERERERER
jgi:hypothetical protein